MRKIKEDQEIILSARLGSHAFGLATEDSDVDLAGVYLDPPERFLGIFPPTERQLTVDNTSESEDYAYHEVAKHLRLAAKCNPTIIEVLFADEYQILTPAGQLLIDNRHIFLSNRARQSFGGYAYAQAKKLEARKGDFGSDLKKRYAKNARHLFRLFAEGRMLLETGDLRIRVTPEERERIFAIGELPWEELVKLFKEEDERFKAVTSVLPDEPDMEAINDLCLRVRALRSL